MTSSQPAASRVPCLRVGGVGGVVRRSLWCCPCVVCVSLWSCGAVASSRRRCVVVVVVVVAWMWCRWRR